MKNEGNKNSIGSEQIKPYKKDTDYSYTLGAFPTFELIDAKPDIVRKVIVHSSFTEQEKLRSICSKNNIGIELNDKLINKLSDKENCYVAGIFYKYECKLEVDKPHIVLVNPSNMGNLGTIIRTAVGFAIYNLAIIRPCAGIFNPKTVRSSMGALFRLNFTLYDSFDSYRQEFGKHEIYTFMLNGENTLTLDNCPKAKLYSLVFGNEASGLDDSFLKVGTSIMIPQSPHVDSLNLTIAVGIGAYVFSNQNRQ